MTGVLTCALPIFRTTPASVTAFITGLYVIFVPLLWSLIRRALPSWNVALGILLALAGLALVTLREAISLTSGEFLVLICAIFCAVHIILTDTFSKRNDAAILTMVQVSIVSLESLAFSLYCDPGVIPDAFPSPVILALIVTSIFATVVAFGVQTAVQKFTSPNHTAIIFTMEPVAAAIFSALMGESPLNLRQYLGGGLIIAAMILTKSGGTNLDDPEIHA